jgi:phospholysine phosphohistidine inorganic pyrophosphate phosphatase
LSELLSSVDGLIIDIDGVLTRGNEVIPGALDALATLRARGIPHTFMTNSTIYCRYTLTERMQQMGIPLEIDQLFNATYVAAQYLRSQNAERYFPLLMPDAQLEFEGMDVDEENPQFVVVGDLGPGFTFTRLNTAFRVLLGGAQLVALHKRRFWRTEDGLYMDAGPFVQALEYAADTGAIVVGKPSSSYFNMVLSYMNLPPDRVAVVGDDIEADVRGAQRIGAKGWLVKTGKFRREDLGRGIWPDEIFGSLEELVQKL